MSSTTPPNKPAAPPSTNSSATTNSSTNVVSSQGLMTIGQYVCKFLFFRKKPFTKCISNQQIDPKDKLGKGGFGVVYKAYDGKTGGFVAVKQIELKKKRKLPQIRNEFNLMKKLHHQHIVKYIDHVETPDNLYIVMEYLESGSLANLVRRFKISEIMVAKYIAQVLQGLKYLHSVGVIHRDIKGDNVLMTKHDRFPILKLADFGIAQNFSQSSSDDVAGSPYWMAPEIVTLNGATFKSDIWSVGALVVELLTGKPPYYDLNHTSAFYRIVHDENPPLPMGITKLATDFLLSCFCKTESFRKSAAELLEHGWIVKALQMDGDANSAVLDATGSPISKISTPLQGQQAKPVSKKQSNDSDSDDSWKDDSDSEDEKQATVQLRKPQLPISTLARDRSATVLKSPQIKLQVASPVTPTNQKVKVGTPTIEKKTKSIKKKKQLSDFAEEDDSEEEEWFNDNKKKSLHVKPIIVNNNKANRSDSEEEEVNPFDSDSSDEESNVVKKEENPQRIKQLSELSDVYHIQSTAEELQDACHLLNQLVPLNESEQLSLAEWFPLNSIELLSLFLDTVQRSDMWFSLVIDCVTTAQKLCQQSKVISDKMITLGFAILCLSNKWGTRLKPNILLFLWNICQSSKQQVIPLHSIRLVDWNTLLSEAIQSSDERIINPLLLIISNLIQKQGTNAIRLLLLSHSVIPNLCQMILWKCKSNVKNDSDITMDTALGILLQMTTCRDFIIKNKLSMHAKSLLYLLRKVPVNQKLSLLNLLKNLCMENRVQDILVKECHMIRALILELSNLVFVTDLLFDSKSVYCKMYGQCMLMLQTLCTFHDTRIVALAQEPNAILILRQVIDKHLPVWDLAASLLLALATNSITVNLFLKNDGLLTLLSMIKDKALVTWRVNAMNSLIDLLEQHSTIVEPFLCKHVPVFIDKCQEYLSTLSKVNAVHWKSFVSSLVQLFETSVKFTEKWILDKTALSIILNSFQQSTIKFSKTNNDTVLYCKDLFTWLRVIADTIQQQSTYVTFEQKQFARECIISVKQVLGNLSEEQVLIQTLAEQGLKQLEKIGK